MRRHNWLRKKIAFIFLMWLFTPLLPTLLHAQDETSVVGPTHRAPGFLVPSFTESSRYDFFAQTASLATEQNSAAVIFHFGEPTPLPPKNPHLQQHSNYSANSLAVMSSSAFLTARNNPGAVHVISGALQGIGALTPYLVDLREAGWVGAVMTWVPNWWRTATPGVDANSTGAIAADTDAMMIYESPRSGMLEQLVQLTEAPFAQDLYSDRGKPIQKIEVQLWDGANIPLSRVLAALQQIPFAETPQIQYRFVLHTGLSLESGRRQAATIPRAATQLAWLYANFPEANPATQFNNVEVECRNSAAIFTARGERYQFEEQVTALDQYRDVAQLYREQLDTYTRENPERARIAPLVPEGDIDRYVATELEGLVDKALLAGSEAGEQRMLARLDVLNQHLTNLIDHLSVLSPARLSPLRENDVASEGLTMRRTLLAIELLKLLIQPEAVSRRVQAIAQVQSEYGHVWLHYRLLDIDRSNFAIFPAERAALDDLRRESLEAVRTRSGNGSESPLAKYGPGYLSPWDLSFSQRNEIAERVNNSLRYERTRLMLMEARAR